MGASRSGSQAADAELMRAVKVTGRAGMCFNLGTCDLKFDRLKVQTVPVPTVKPGKAVVEVFSSSVNPLDWKLLANPNFRSTPGSDFAGRVLAAEGPCAFQAGDLVWGDSQGSFAEEVLVDCSHLGLRPRNISVPEAGALPHVGLTGLQALRSSGAPWSAPGTVVLVLGGSGGTGHVGIQLAKALGASKVVTTASASGAEWLKSLGADEVIDYKEEKWWEVMGPLSVDVIYDTVGEAGTGVHAYDALKDGGHFVSLLPTSQAPPQVAKRRPSVSQRFMEMSEKSTADLDVLKDLVEAGILQVRVATSFDLELVGKAFQASRSGHTHGKIAVHVSDP